VQPQTKPQFRNPGLVNEEKPAKKSEPVKKTEEKKPQPQTQPAQKPKTVKAAVAASQPKQPVSQPAAEVKPQPKQAEDPKRKPEPAVSATLPATPARPVNQDPLYGRSRSLADGRQPVMAPVTAPTKNLPVVSKPQKQNKKSLKGYLKFMLVLDILLAALAGALYLPFSPLRKNLIIGALSKKTNRHIVYALYSEAMIEETVSEYLNPNR
jgi:hypothetical protein